ncbi:MAG: right-handed parallel beta-helix repeat-containing protein, partial [Candidatus Hydrogenedentes bacterium]|nr:right-handed parallel beta-helix repeat-containing protein [Candidatus Hydrogenedentota bacterium]
MREGNRAGWPLLHGSVYGSTIRPDDTRRPSSMHHAVQSKIQNPKSKISPAAIPRLFSIILLALLAASCPGPNAGPWRSALYPANWTPAVTDSNGRFLHDFSYAGYRNGPGAPKGEPKAKFLVTDYGADETGAGDSTAAFQAAIDAAQNAGGGVVFVPAGLYRCDGTLLVTASNMVVRGEGPDTSRVYFTAVEGMAYKGFLVFRGAVQQDADLALTQDGENRSFEVTCADASALSPGDDVALGWTISDAFIEEHGMTGTWRAFNGTWQTVLRRNVAAVDTSSAPHRVTLDVPLRYPAKVRDGASLRAETGYLEECGVENLGIATAVAWDDAWSQMQVDAIDFDGVKDGWIRNVHSFSSPHPDADGYHLQNGGIKVHASKRVTIADCILEKAQNRGGGGCGYLFQISQCSEVLVRDCTGRDGRHNFIQNWGFGTTGCVFLRCTSSGSTNMLSSSIPIGLPAYSEYHHSLAMACLVDACTLDDGWYGGNRHDESTGAGHTVTENVYWNTSGAGLIRSFAYGEGYVIGTRGVRVQTGLGDPRADGTAPEDYVEGKGLGATLE